MDTIPQNIRVWLTLITRRMLVKDFDVVHQEIVEGRI